MKALFKHFQEDRNLFHDSFHYGEYWCLVDISYRYGKKYFIVNRVVRKKDKLFLSRKHKTHVFYHKNNDYDYEIGDVLFFDHGGVTNRDGSKHFELVSSLIREECKDFSEDEKIKIMKRYPRG